jgi:hypothetical protein
VGSWRGLDGLLLGYRLASGGLLMGSRKTTSCLLMGF